MSMGTKTVELPTFFKIIEHKIRYFYKKTVLFHIDFYCVFDLYIESQQVTKSFGFLHSLKYNILCSIEESQSNRFATT